MITGAGGFIGSHLVESQLAQGHQVRAVDLDFARLSHLTHHPNLAVVVGDISDASQIRTWMDGIEIVYHLASAHLDVSRSAEHYHRINVEATRLLLAAAHDSGVSRFVHVSSNGVLGELRELPADETTPCRPTNVYEKTKLAGEQAALEFARNTGLAVIVVRPAWVYGPRCPRTARLMRMVRRGRFFMFGDGQTLRHPIAVDDAIRGLELCAGHGIPGEVYFLAGATPVTLTDLVKTMAEVQGVRVSIWRVPLIVGIVAGYAVQVGFGLLGKAPPISRRTLDFFIKDNAYRIDKARRDLGFEPKIALRDGLRTLSALDQ